MNNISKKILTFFLFLNISSVVLSKSTIKKLTSKEKSEKLKEQIHEIKKVTEGALGGHSVGIGIGQFFLQGGFNDFGQDKITFDLFYNYLASYSFDFMINLHHSSHKKKKNEISLTALAIGIKAKIFNFDAFSPYVYGGFGFYIPKVTRALSNKTIISETKTVFGYHFGGGAELDLNKKFKVGIMAHLHNPFDVQQDDQPAVVGHYYKFLLTLFYKF